MSCIVKQNTNTSYTVDSIITTRQLFGERERNICGPEKRVIYYFLLAEFTVASKLKGPALSLDGGEGGEKKQSHKEDFINIGLSTHC